MTRTIPCTTLFTCVKPINMCSIYTGDNISAWGMHKSTSCMYRWGSTLITPTKTTSCMFSCGSTPATTNNQYEHEHNMFIVGRETTNFHRKLIKVDPGSLGTAGSWGCLVEFLETPHQCCVPQEVQVSSEMQSHISEEIVELLSKGAIEEAQLGPQKLHIQNFPSREKRWGTLSFYKPQEVEPLCQDRTLQDGWFTPSSISDPAGGLDGETVFERCLLAGANPSRSASPPPVSVAKENLPVQVSSIQTFSSTLSVYQAAETSSGFPSPNGHSTDHISRWYINPPSSQRPARATSHTRLPGSRPIDKLTFDPSSTSGIPGVSNMLLHSNNDICAKRETLQNQPGCLSPAIQDNSISEGVGKVCREGCSHSARNISSSTALQSLTEIDKLCAISRFLPFSSNREIQCTSTLISGGKSRPHVVSSICQGGSGGTSSFPQWWEYW